MKIDFGEGNPDKKPSLDAMRTVFRDYREKILEGCPEVDTLTCDVYVNRHVHITYMRSATWLVQHDMFNIKVDMAYALCSKLSAMGWAVTYESKPST
jgi:hypothetical protein